MPLKLKPFIKEILSTEDRRERENRFNQLTLPEQKELIFNISQPKLAYDLILSSKELGSLLKSLPVSYNYSLLIELGIEDSAEIFLYSSAIQRKKYLDLSIWNYDRLDLNELDRWLNALASVDKEQTNLCLSELDESLLCHWINENLIIECKYDCDDIEDLVPHQEAVTFDNIYYFRPKRDEGFNPDMIYFLKQFGSQNPQGLHLLLENSRYLISESNMENLYQDKNIRLEEEGFPSFESALKVYGPPIQKPQEKIKNESNNLDLEETGDLFSKEDILKLIWKVSTVRKLKFQDKDHLKLAMREIRALMELGKSNSNVNLITAEDFFKAGWEMILELQKIVRKSAKQFKEHSGEFPWRFIDSKFSLITFNLFQPFPFSHDPSTGNKIIPEGKDDFDFFKKVFECYSIIFAWSLRWKPKLAMSNQNTFLDLITTRIATKNLQVKGYNILLPVSYLEDFLNKIVRPCLNSADFEISIDPFLMDAEPELYKSLSTEQKKVLYYLLRSSWKDNLEKLNIEEGIDPQYIQGVICSHWKH